MNYVNRLTRVFSCVVVSIAFLGCYTVLSSPYAIDNRSIDKIDSMGTNKQVFSNPVDETAKDDFYRYPRTYGGYGGLGYPIYGGYVGNNPYSYGGYSPYNYGYDPYYSSGGYYVPPGYELVSTRELENIRSSIENLDKELSDVDQNNEPQTTLTGEDVWLRRTEPRMRKVPALPRNSIDSVVPRTSTTASKPASEQTAKTAMPASKSASGQSTMPKKKRR